MTIGVVGEIRQGKPTRETIEAMCHAACLKEKGLGSMVLILMETRERIQSPWIDHWGADRVVAYELDRFERRNVERKLSVLEAYVRENQLKALLFAGSIQGQELAPRLATRVGASALVDCLAVSGGVKSEELLVTKPIYGGNAYGEYRVSLPCFLTFRGKTIKPVEKKGMEIPVEWRTLAKAQKTNSVISRRLLSADSKDLEEKKILFICGRGIGNQVNLERIQALANRYSAGIAGTKKAIENGWLPLEAMVGQTGKILAPDLCIVWGASGATPFVHGIAGAEKIIAVNKDDQARIFEFSDLGHVADCERVITVLENRMKENL